jgi:hypothetical protein
MTGTPTLVGTDWEDIAMSISAVGSTAGYVPQVHTQAAPNPARTAPVSVGGDSDGDNDGSKGGTIDVRA